MECPIKRLAVAIVASTVENPIAQDLKSKMIGKDCDPNCAWSVLGKCAITVAATKES